jgi:hypothetical protein
MSIVRSGLTRKALAGTALAALLLVGGAVAVPTAATATPVVVTDEVDGTVFRAKVEAKDDVLIGHTKKPTQIAPFDIRYSVALGTEGGVVTGVSAAQLTLQRVGSVSTRRYPISFDDGLRIWGGIELPPTAVPGRYDVGLEITATVKRGTQVTTHTVDVSRVKQVLLRRDTLVSTEISNPDDTSSELGTLSGTVERLRVQYPTGVGSYRVAGGVTVRIYHATGPFDGDKATYVKSVRTNGAGEFTTSVRAKAGYWKVIAVGNDQYAWEHAFASQGAGCGC